MPPMWVFMAGGSLLIGAASFGAGWQTRSWKADSDELEVLQDGITRGREQQQLADYAAGRYEDQRDDAQTATLARDTEIRTIYRTQQVLVPAECEPPVDAVRVLDGAITAANAQTAGQPEPVMPTDSGEAEPLR